MRRLNDKANNMTQTPPKSMAALICLAVFAVLAARFDQRWIDMSYLPSLAAGNTSWVAKIQEGYGGVVLANSTTWLGPTANTTFSMLNFLGGNRNESESVTVSTASTMSSLEEQTSANLTLVVQVAGELGNHVSTCSTMEFYKSVQQQQSYCHSVHMLMTAFFLQQLGYVNRGIMLGTYLQNI